MEELLRLDPFLGTLASVEMKIEYEDSVLDIVSCGEFPENGVGLSLIDPRPFRFPPADYEQECLVSGGFRQHQVCAGRSTLLLVGEDSGEGRVESTAVGALDHAPMPR